MSFKFKSLFLFIYFFAFFESYNPNLKVRISFSSHYWLLYIKRFTCTWSIVNSNDIFQSLKISRHSHIICSMTKHCAVLLCFVPSIKMTCHYFSTDFQSHRPFTTSKDRSLAIFYCQGMFIFFRFSTEQYSMATTKQAQQSLQQGRADLFGARACWAALRLRGPGPGTMSHLSPLCTLLHCNVRIA